MKRFLVHTALFLLSFLGLTALAFYISNSTIATKGNFVFKKQFSYVVVGHSHPQCAINDSLIPGLKNIANSGEAYFYNYIKLKEVLRQNPKITTVFVEFTNNHIDTLMNTWTWGEVYTTRYSFLLPFASRDEHTLLLDKNTSGYLQTIPATLKSNFLHLIKDDYHFTDEIGGFREINQNRVDSLLKNRKEAPKLPHNEEYPTSIESIRYLQKIIAEGKKYRTQIILIRSPQHPKLTIRNNERYFQQIRKTYFGDLPFLDFNDFPVEKKYYADLEHLNTKGAEVFSIWFNGLLEKGLLNTKNKAAFVKANMPE